MKHGSTIFLRILLGLIGIAVLGLCIFILPQGIMAKNVGGYRPILIGMYIPAVPFFIALFQIFKLLNLIDNNKAFSQASIDALRIIKYCTGIIGVLYAIALPYIYIMAQSDDAPGVMLIGLVFTCGPLVIAAFAATLQHLLTKALNIKSENELTV
jgi:hypothetical protein